MLQAVRLRSEFGAVIDWKGYELFPDELEWGNYSPPPPAPANKPPTPTRFEFILAADGIELPQSIRPQKMRTHNAHEAVEFAKTLGKADQLIEALYHAYWVHGIEINRVEKLLEIAEPILGSTELLKVAIEQRAFKANIVGFDDDAYRLGVYNVPTFFIGDQRLAEQPYSVLKRAVEALPSRIYSPIFFPPAPAERPYIYADMVTTIDGKILSGERGESVSDLGSSVDHQVLVQLESASDGVIVGAGTLRATGNSWNPKPSFRFVVSRSGDLPFDAKFFDRESYVITIESASLQLPPHVKVIKAGNTEIDFASALQQISELGVTNLLLLGGSSLNGELLGHGLVDELFLTITPKIKLGDHTPTYAGGQPLSRSELQNFSLVEHYVVEHEVFLRYRKVPSSSS
jgi:riboflavin biosynthesis pyrimidine reductase/predicted DsbA family dithiol-disulfide isomerase